MGKRYKWNTHIPDFAYCTDNAGMIAITAYHKFLAGEFSSLHIGASAKA
jgi:N6-L-threonylcarbamoyladenine synthase